MSFNGNTTQKQVYLFWSPDGTTMVPVSSTNPLPTTGSGGGGGGAVTIASGADVTEGTIGDTQATGTVVGYLKSLYTNFFGTPQAIKVDGSGAIQPVSQSGTWTVGLSAGSAVIGHVVTDTGSTTAITQASAIAVAGQGVLGSTAPANATQTGVKAQTTNPTAVTSGQMIAPTADKVGKLVTVDAIRTLKLSQKTTLSNTTAETTVLTAGATNVFNDVFSVIFANTGAISTKVDVRDATAGTIILTVYVPAGETRGFTLPAGSGYSQTTAANNWTAQCASATTAMEITVQYVQNI